MKTAILAILLMLSVSLAGCTLDEEILENTEEDESFEGASKEECEERGGIWTEVADGDGVIEILCEFTEEGGEEREESAAVTQEECERRGGTWIEDRRTCQE